MREKLIEEVKEFLRIETCDTYEEMAFETLRIIERTHAIVPLKAGQEELREMCIAMLGCVTASEIDVINNGRAALIAYHRKTEDQK